MNINDINPFLRFVNSISFNPINKYCCAIDCHFYFMHDNCCPIYINNKKYETSKGTIIIIPAGMNYYFDYKEKLNIISINFDYTQSKSYIEAKSPVSSKHFNKNDITEKPNFDNYEFLNKPIIIENMWYLFSKIETILNEYKYKKQFYKEVSSSCFKNVLLEIIRSYLWKDNTYDAINIVLDYIHDHYNEEIDNSTLSNLVNYHSYHLNRLMKTTTGTTIHQYIINYRLEIAKRYLQETELSINEVAELCGYKNLCNFSFDFKKRHGVSPSTYRNNTYRKA